MKKKQLDEGDIWRIFHDHNMTMKKKRGIPHMENPPTPSPLPTRFLRDYYTAASARMAADRAANDLEKILSRINEAAQKGIHHYEPPFEMSEDIKAKLKERLFAIESYTGPYEQEMYYISWK